MEDFRLHLIGITAPHRVTAVEATKKHVRYQIKANVVNTMGVGDQVTFTIFIIRRSRCDLRAVEPAAIRLSDGAWWRQCPSGGEPDGNGD